MAKEYSTREVMTIMRSNGFNIQRHNGGHGIFSDGKRTVSIPMHNKCVNRMLFKRLVKENELILSI